MSHHSITLLIFSRGHNNIIVGITNSGFRRISMVNRCMGVESHGSVSNNNNNYMWEYGL